MSMADPYETWLGPPHDGNPPIMASERSVRKRMLLNVLYEKLPV